MTFPEPTLSAILGTAVSDAYGAPFEFAEGAPEHSLRSIAEKRYLRCREDVGVPIRRCRTAGLYTDDTQQSLILLWIWNQMVDKNKDPLAAEAVATLFSRVCSRMATEKVDPRAFTFGLHRGTGKNFREAVIKGEPPDTAGLGAAMRIGPVATLFPTPEALLPWVITVSSGTTSNPIALAGAALLSLHAWGYAHSKEDAIQTFPGLDQTPRDVQDAWGLFNEARRVLRVKGPAGLLAFASNHTTETLKGPASGFALTGVPWVLQCVEDATSFEDALTRVCAEGGDTDTVCAMAGCLAALRFSQDAIPRWMIDGLVGREHVLDPTLWHPITSERPYIEMDLALRASIEQRVREEAQSRKKTPSHTSQET